LSLLFLLISGVGVNQRIPDFGLRNPDFIFSFGVRIPGLPLTPHVIPDSLTPGRTAENMTGPVVSQSFKELLALDFSPDSSNVGNIGH